MDTTTKRSRGRPKAFNPNPEQTTVQALDRALAILKVLAGGEGMSLTELAEASGQAPATVYRVLSTFRRTGSSRCSRRRSCGSSGRRRSASAAPSSAGRASSRRRAS